jgi:hypothetical protein
MESIIKYLLLVVILFSFFSFGKKGVATNTGDFVSDTTIISDPFRTFTPAIYTSIAENNRYVEWPFSGVFGNVYVEKIYCTDVKDSVIFISSGVHGINMLLNVSRRIILPDKSKNTEISLSYHYETYPRDTEMTLKVIFFAGNTEIKEYIEKIPSTIGLYVKGKEVREDEIPVATFKYRIPQGANNLNVALHTYNDRIIQDISTVSNMPDSILHAEIGIAHLSLHKFGIKIDGKPLETYSFNHESPFTKKEIREISSKTNDSLIVGNDVRIVGIGESVHGSGTFLEQDMEIIKQLINQGFNVIGIETSITNGIRINDYIKGNRSDIKDILNCGRFNFYNNKTTKELFDYLRVYNKNNGNKISIFGFDIVSTDDKDSLISAAKSGFKISKYENFNEYLKNFYDRYNFCYKKGYAFEILMKSRDKIMSENVSYMAENFAAKDKIILVAHLGHLSKKKSPEPSAGYYLSEQYGDRYSVVGLFAGGGTFFSNYFEGFDTFRVEREFTLSKPIGKSLEQLCNAFHKDQFYINNISQIELLDKVLYSRYIGAGYTVMQFKPVELRKEIDMIWFAKESIGSEM